MSDLFYKEILVKKAVMKKKDNYKISCNIITEKRKKLQKLYLNNKNKTK